MIILNKTQKSIVDAIKHEVSLNMFDCPQAMFMAVYFYPQKGIFLYGDAPVKHEDIYPLIESSVLIYKAIEKHQGIKMVKYTLNNIQV